MTEGTSQGLFIVVAIVIFGIFVVLAYILFEDTLSPAMASMFNTAIENTEKNTTRFERISEDVIRTNEYEFNEKTGTIILYLGDSTDIVIPSRINGVKVRELGSRSFNAMGLEPDEDSLGFRTIQKELRSVKFPNTLEVIGDKAFNSNKLKKIVIPNSVKTLGREAFQYNILEEVQFSTSMTEILAETFEANLLKKVYIPKNIKRIENRAFINNHVGMIVDMPSGIEWNPDEYYVYRVFPLGAVIIYY